MVWLCQKSITLIYILEGDNSVIPVLSWLWPNDNAFNGVDLHLLEIHYNFLIPSSNNFWNNNIFQARAEATERISNEETNTITHNMQCDWYRVFLHDLWYQHAPIPNSTLPKHTLSGCLQSISYKMCAFSLALLQTALAAMLSSPLQGL